MGKRMDALLRRGFKSPKFKTLVSLAVSRLAVLKNQRQVRCSQARTDVSKLLQLGHHERALLRVEHVIQEQNMLDAFVMIEGYCHVLIERVSLIEDTRECSEELKEAVSSLIYASSRCGQFPELQEIRSVLASWYGREFTEAAADLRNGCGVKTLMIQKLSTRQKSLESRMKVLKEIASENGITSLQLDQEQPNIVEEEKRGSNRKHTKLEQDFKGNLEESSVLKEQDHGSVEEIQKDEQFSGSLRSKKKYADVASAAQAAFESAANAAAAARAAMELSKSASQDNIIQEEKTSPSSRLPKNKSKDERFSTSQVGSPGYRKFEKTHPVSDYISESEGEEQLQKPGEFHSDEKDKKVLSRSVSSSSSNSDSKSLKEIRVGSNEEKDSETVDKIAFDESDDDNNEIHTENGGIPMSRRHVLDIDAEKPGKAAYEFPKIKQTKSTDYEDEGPPFRLNIDRKPISVRTRQGRR
ncbi:hypothetical protein Scep_022528 [Stephania cephalantha]|uniref:IST1-like protein n=1 Tax=Stephania cephalantha TaxID=152367 RepID=A0AAP0FHW7_9MAGN